MQAVSLGIRDVEIRDLRTRTQPDLGPCDACLRELANTRGRRFADPFIRCAACGPCPTIAAPIDYVPCEACRREHDDPASRRYRTAPTCPACGPRVRLLAGGRILEDRHHALAIARGLLATGSIVAIKAAGGFALVADATCEPAVARLRARTRRPYEPFTVRGRSLGALRDVAVLDEQAIAHLGAPVRPIVELPARADGRLARSIAPGLADVGVGLPPTPLHELLHAGGPALLAVTRGGIAGAPAARTNEEAVEALGEVADAFLVHDLDIRVPAGDSIVRSTCLARGPIPVRRARGLVPEPIALPVGSAPVVAVGGHAHAAVCFARDGRAVLSPDAGSLDHPGVARCFAETLADMLELAGDAPVLAHDLDADFLSTRWAITSGMQRIAVQHHHAHVAACLAEHGRSDLVIGVAFDGGGLGDDGTTWGGEILAADLGGSRRLGHLRALAGATPRELAASALRDAGEMLGAFADVEPRCAMSTAAGRWFDAIGALLGIDHGDNVPARLEALAAPGDAPPFDLAFAAFVDRPFEIDLRPAVREIVYELRRGTPPAILAARFHATLARAIREACRRVALPTVALGGGCFTNRRLLEDTVRTLERDGFEVLAHLRVPANGGGLALGQAAIASFELARGPATSA